ncbi:MAG: chemotaxis protein CheR [Geobacter sp.]|nr:chemotaxis protein CheR [Geobacter sp.]
MKRHLPPLLLSRLSGFVADRLGLHFPQQRWHDLERRINQAVADFGFGNAKTCIEWLLAEKLSPEQIGMLARHLTIGETYFFREKSSFEKLETVILPELIAARRGKDQRLRIWSAGCSSGEEPYSVAMSLCRLLPDLQEWQITILGTDVNPAALAKAARGSYGNWSFRGMPAWLRDRYFTRENAGTFRISDAIRGMVTLAPLNLAQDRYPALINNTNAMDIILCRNVLMYFEPAEALRVVGCFHRSLLDGGWLFVSPCEASADLFRDFETISCPGTIFYRKSVTGSPVPGRRPEAGTELPASGQSPNLDGCLPVTAVEAVPSTLADDRVETTPAARAIAAEQPETPVEEPDAASMAREFANQGKLHDALAWLEKAIVMSKTDPELYFLRAMIHQELGEADAAIESLKQTLFLDHDFALAHFALGNLSLQTGKTLDAKRHFGNALELLQLVPAAEPLHGGEGLTAGRLAEIVATVQETAIGHG